MRWAIPVPILLVVMPGCAPVQRYHPKSIAPASMLPNAMLSYMKSGQNGQKKKGLMVANNKSSRQLALVLEYGLPIQGPAEPRGDTRSYRGKLHSQIQPEI